MDVKTPRTWHKGQKVAIGNYITEVERVTPSGRAVVGGKQFDRDGYEIGGSRLRREWLVVLTPEVEARIAEVDAFHNMRNRWEKCERALRDRMGGWGREPSITSAALGSVCDAIDAALKDAPQ